MAGGLLTDEDKITEKKNVVLPNDAENIIDRTRKKSYEKKISQNI